MEGFRCWKQLGPLWRQAGVRVYPHQVDSARRVLEEMGCRAILADEVGLGKTVEAGLVLRELMARGQVHKVLALVPASLVGQWAEELAGKFGLDFCTGPRGAQWLEEPRLLASLDRAKRQDARRLLALRRFDLVIVDEAHHLKNLRTLNYQLIEGLATRFLLLLTATPVQNELPELYNLVHLAQPERFPSYLRFYGALTARRGQAKHAGELHELLDRVMVRHRRSEVLGQLPPRRVSLLPVELSTAERELYREVSRVLRREYRRRSGNGAGLLPLITLQRELCSSSFALRATLERMGEEVLGGMLPQLVGRAAAVRENRKAQVLEDLVGGGTEQLIVFTEYRATQEHLFHRLKAAGRRAVLFHGGLSAHERSRALGEFRRGAQVLIATDAGGQGLNLQFCHRLINYDLPWNPMRVEQRIGRVHRLGQEHPVEIFNLYARETVEEHVLHLLHRKIDLFRRVVGELDVIIERLERQRSFEGRVVEIVLGSEAPEEIRLGLERLGDEVLRVRRRVARELTSAWPAEGLPPYVAPC